MRALALLLLGVPAAAAPVAQPGAIGLELVESGQVVAVATLADPILAVTQQGGVAYVACVRSIRVFDTARPESFREIARLSVPEREYTVRARDARLTAFFEDGWTLAWDLRDPRHPVPASPTKTEVVAVVPGRVTVRGDSPLHLGDRLALADGNVVELDWVGPSGGEAALPRGARAAIGESASETIRPPTRSLVAPPRSPGITRVTAIARPSLIVGSQGGFGAQAELSVDHYFTQPMRLGVTVAPLAFAAEPNATGGSTMALAHVAYSGDRLEIGVGLGAAIHSRESDAFAASGLVRFGSLDGLHLAVELTMVVPGGQPRFESAMAELDVPVTSRVSLTVSAGGAADGTWSYADSGVKIYLRGQGGPGTFVLLAAIGETTLREVDAFQFGVYAAGPALVLGLDARL
jgi:hypothetical protein